MSFVNEFESVQIEPHYFSANDRVEFRIANNLKGKLIRPNLRLANLMIRSNNNNSTYGMTIGAWALIRRITLYNDNRVLNHLYDAQNWLAFQNMMAQGGSQDGIKKPNTMNRWNFVYDDDEDKNIKLPNLDEYNLVKSAVNTDLKDNTPLLDLSEALPLLQVIPYLDTDVFDKLRLVIEFENRAGRVFNVDGNAVASMSQPTLIYEEIKDPQVLANKQSKMTIPFVNMMLEDVRVPAIGADNTQAPTVKARIKAFDSRIVRRLLIVNQVENNDVSETGYWNSVSFPNEVYRLEINGLDMVPYGGIKGHNQKLALCNDTWGAITMPQGSQMNLLTNVARDKQTSEVWATLKKAQCGYLGLPVNQRIDEFNLTYDRKSKAGALVNDVDRSAFVMKIYGETEMVLVIDGNRFDVQY